MGFEDIIKYIRKIHELRIETLFLEEQYEQTIEDKNKEIDSYQEEVKKYEETIEYQKKLIDSLSERKIYINNRNILIGFGNYNELIQGNYLNMSQNLSQVEIEIHELLTDLEQNKNISFEDAQYLVAKDLASQARNNSKIKSNLINWEKYLDDNVNETTINERVIKVIKLALCLVQD